MSAHVDLSALEPDCWAPHANDDARTTVKKAVHRIGGVAPATEIARHLARIGRSRIAHADVLDELKAAGEIFATPTGWTTSKELAEAAGEVGDTGSSSRADLRLVADSGHDVPHSGEASSVARGATVQRDAADQP